MSSFLKHTLTFLLGISLGISAHALGKILVMVNDLPITETELAERAALVKQYAGPEEHEVARIDLVKSLIMEEIMLQVAQKNGASLDSEEMNQIVEQTIQSGEVPPELAKNKEKLKKRLIIQQMQQSMMSSVNLVVTEEEITEQIKTLADQFEQKSPVRYHIETLVIPTSSSTGWKLPWIPRPKDKVSEAHSTLKLDIARQAAEKAFIESTKAGVSFTQLASARKGQWKVESAWRTEDKLPAAYLSALASLKPGDVAGPFLLQNGFHLIRLQEASGPIVAQARHIVFKQNKHTSSEQIKKRLEDIRQLCLKGQKDFQQQAEQYSEDPATVFRGGDLGWILPGVLDKAFDAPIASLKPGGISLPFKSRDGWHIIQLTHKQFLTPHHPEWKRYVAKKLIKQRKMMEALENIQNELYASAHIE